MVKTALLSAALLGVLGATAAPAADMASAPHRREIRLAQPADIMIVEPRHRGPYTIGYGDTIISGRTGQHRSHLLGRMVPDSDPPDLILSGRRRGSGLGANGLPGSNLDD